MTERDTDIEFDFFDEPETEEATERVRTPRRPPPGGPRRPVRPPAGPDPDAQAGRADRLRDPRGRPADRRPAQLRFEQQARQVPGVHPGRALDRRGLDRDRQGPEQEPVGDRHQGDRPRGQAQRPRRPAAAGGRPGRAARPTGTAPRRARSSDRGPQAPRQRTEQARGRVPSDGDGEERDELGTADRRPGAAADRERRQLGLLLQGADAARAPAPGHHRHRRRSGLHDLLEPRSREHAGDDRCLATRARRGNGRQARRAATTAARSSR